MGCKIKFIDGEELSVQKAEESYSEENSLVLRDEDEEQLFEINFNQIKYIEWD